MSNAMKYIRDLEAVGFERNQAEAQVQMVLDALEGDLATKSDFAVLTEQIKSLMAQHMSQHEMRMNQRFSDVDQKFSGIDQRFAEFELRILTRLGFLYVSTTSIAVAVLTWLIKI
ncbi:MAG: hypothetical protein AABZ31_06595 [Bdellovibrionota bacterium]